MALQQKNNFLCKQNISDHCHHNQRGIGHDIGKQPPRSLLDTLDEKHIGRKTYWMKNTLDEKHIG